MKRIFTFLAAAAALAACSKEGQEPIAPNDGEIRIYTGVDAPGTKAVVDAATGMTEATFVMKEATAAPAADFSGGTVYKGSVAATNGKVTFAGSAPTYNHNDDNAYFVAYYPGNALNGNAVNWTVDGKTDILVTDAIWDAGKYSAPLTGATGTKLNFNHQLSQVEVVCKAEAGAAHSVVKAAWGKIRKIEFLNAPATVTYSLAGAPAVSAAGSADFTLLKNYNDSNNAFEAIDIPENTNTTANAMAMLYPVAPGAGESFKLKVTTAGPAGGSAIAVEVPVSLGGNKTAMGKGQTHTVTLTFEADALNIAVSDTTIDNWGDGADGDSGVVKPGN